MSELREADLIESNMSTNVETVEPTESVKNALRRIVAHSIGSILLVDENEPVGIITERDSGSSSSVQELGKATGYLDELPCLAFG